MLEPYDGKLSRTVLRGEEGRKPLALPGAQNSILLFVIVGDIFNSSIGGITNGKNTKYRSDY